jgi:hypothetical protein
MRYIRDGRRLAVARSPSTLGRGVPAAPAKEAFCVVVIVMN